MRIAIVGAGPAGLFLGAGLARRGHQVTAVERDPGPAADGTWPRRGVMQFHHAHAFRPQVAQALEQELPEALRQWLAAGAEPVRLRLPDAREMPAGMRSRRMTFERALRTAALAVPGFEVRRGHVEEVASRHGRADGIRFDGAILPADLVIDASGRAGRATRSLRPAVTSGGPCGIAYVDRQYQLLPGAEPGPLVNPVMWQAELDGYQVLVFVHEHGIFSVLLARPIADRVLAELAGHHQRTFLILDDVHELTSPEALDAVCGLAAIAIERAGAVETLTRVQASRESERLRNALLDSLLTSCALRLPRSQRPSLACARTLSSTPTSAERIKGTLTSMSHIPKTRASTERKAPIPITKGQMEEPGKALITPAPSSIDASSRSSTREPIRRCQKK